MEALQDLDQGGHHTRAEGTALDSRSTGRTRQADVETLHDKSGGESAEHSETRDFASTVKVEEPKSAPSPPPDGGIEAWLQVAGSFFCWFNSWGLTNAFGVFQTYYEQELLHAQSPEQISWIGSLQSFLLLAVGVLTGPIYDAGYLKALIWTGTFLVVFGYMMTSICSSYGPIIVTQGLLVGIGSGCLFLPSTAVLPQYFQKKRALANGIAASGSSFGGVIYPILFRQILPQIGFGWSVRVLAFVALATCVFSLSVLKVRVKPPRRRVLFDFSAFKKPSFSMFTAGLFLGLMGLYIPTFYVQSFAVQKGIASVHLGGFMLPILNAAGVAGRIVPNFVADKTGPLNVITPFLAMAGISTLAWISVNNTGGLIVWVLAYGFCSGAILSLPPMVVATLSPSLSVIGTWMGTCFAVASLGVLIGTPISGAILRQGNGFVGLQIFGGVTLLAAAAFCLGARLFKSGVKLKVKS